MPAHAADTKPRRRLVVVRAGDQSLHPRWLSGREQPTFDLMVSYYGDDPSMFADATVRHVAKGGKWDGLHAFFTAYPETLQRYDWFWLPDDDIDATPETINRLFDMMEHHGLDLAQPSLTWDSHVSHLLTLQNRACRLRWTNFVEVMVPAFSRALLRRVLPVFAQCRYGWGMEFLWPRWIEEPRFKTAMIDAVAVRHTRPVGTGPLSRDSNDAADQESRRLVRAYLPRLPKIAIYAALDARGTRLRRGVRLWRALYCGWAPLRHTFARSQGASSRPLTTRRLIQAVAKANWRRFDLTPLPPPSEISATLVR